MSSVIGTAAAAAAAVTAASSWRFCQSLARSGLAGNAGVRLPQTRVLNSRGER